MGVSRGIEKLVVTSLYLCSKAIESLVQMLIASIYLLCIVYDACAIGTHGSDQQGYARSNVRRCHGGGSQTHRVILTDHYRPVRITKDDLSPHVDQFVDEKQAALEH